jgi:N-acetylmuramoyl-L-alanine amidase
LNIFLTLLTKVSLRLITICCLLSSCNYYSDFLLFSSSPKTFAKEVKNLKHLQIRPQAKLPIIKERIIVIDPGHGGLDSGAVSKNGQLKEKDISLEIAKRLALKLEEFGYKALLTRTDDTFSELADRTAFANEQQADLFISLHVNASRSGKARGFEVYYLDNDGDKAAMQLAERENKIVGGKKVDELDFILSDLIQNAKLEESIILAHLIDEKVVNQLISKGIDTPSKGIKKAPFYVLVGAHMPCVLVELLFIDNPEDYRLLVNEEVKQELVNGLALGIYKFFAKN